MKLGFACKYLNADLQQPYPFKSPTRKRFLSLDQDKRRELLLSCASHNLSQLAHIFSELAQLPHQLRMMRIGSDLLPLFTVPEAQEPYQSLLPDLLPLFAHAGALAKKSGYQAVVSSRPVYGSGFGNAGGGGQGAGGH